MRIVLVVPSRSDPAHRRVASALSRRWERKGDEVLVFPAKGRGARHSDLEHALRGVDVCHVQFFSRGLGYLDRVLLPPGLRLILTHQGASLDLIERRDAFARLARRADVVTCVSRAGLRELRARFPSTRRKSLWVPNGTDIDVIRPSRAGRSSGRPYILTVGRVAAYKGTDLLLMAFSCASGPGPGPDLLICGPDQAGGRLQDFSKKLGLAGRVRFLGDTSAARVRRLLADCLFFVLPSRRENMPMALLEAMAAGKAVVASSVGGVAEAVTHGADGLLVAPGDVAALTRAMRRLLADAKLRTRLGRRAEKRARLFGWDAVAARYRRLHSGGDGAQERQIL